jgi:hypothetical protein
MKRIALAIPAVALACMVSACQDVAPPVDPTATSIGPSFDQGGSDRECTGLTVGGPFDNIVVPPGQRCQLGPGATVKGNVKALENSTLNMLETTVGGNVDGDKAETVQLQRNTIGGSIQIKEGDSPNNDGFDVFVCDNTVTHGNIQVEKMVGSIIIGGPGHPVPVVNECLPNRVSTGNIKVEDNIVVPLPLLPTAGLVIHGNTVGQNLQVFKNRNAPGVAAPKTVQNNRVGESIQCKENDPPFVSSGNMASKDECPSSP